MCRGRWHKGGGRIAIHQHRRPAARWRSGACRASVFDYIDGGADARGHAARELPRVRRRDVPSALRRGDAVVRSADDGARHADSTCRSSSRRSAAAACSIRAAKRWPRVSAGAAGTIYIAVDALGLPARRREGGHAAGRRGTSSISSAAATSRAPRSSARAQPGSRRSSSPSTRRSAGMRERDVRNGAKELLTRKLGADAAVRPAVPARPALARRFLRDGGLMKFPNVVLPDGTDALRRRRRGARAVDGGVERSSVDPRRLERADRRQRRAHRRRCAAGDRRGRRRRSSSRITAAGSSMASRRRLRVAARSRRGGRRPHRGAARRRHPPRQRHRQGAVPRRARRPGRPRLRLRPRRRRRRRRQRARSTSCAPTSSAR